MVVPRPRWAFVFPAAYVAVWVWAAIRPEYPFGWMIENLLVFLGVPFLIALDRWQPFSASSLFLLSVFLAFHAVGSHWTYAYVPGPWQHAGHGPIATFFTFASADGRNYFDRVVHFLYGLLLAPVLVQVLVDRQWAKRPAAWAIALMAVLATGALYEIIEMAAAYIVDPSSADRFLGQQGDQFDAVKDMAMAGIGAAMSLVGWLAIRLLVRHPKTPATAF